MAFTIHWVELSPFLVQQQLVLGGMYQSWIGGPPSLDQQQMASTFYWVEVQSFFHQQQEDVQGEELC